MKKSALTALWLAAFVLTAAFALWLRADTAERRLVHADEAEQAMTLLKLCDAGEYKYNPDGPHGPSLYYYAYALSPLMGVSENIEMADLRFGLLGVFILTALAFALFAPLAGRIAVLAAFAALSISTLSVIYSGYFVHEALFALFTLCCLGLAWSFANSPSLKTALLLGLSAGLAQATKETAPIAFFCILLALAPALSAKFKCGNSRKAVLRLLPAMLLAAFAVFALLYSSFFTNPRGLWDALASYAHFFEKSHAQAHSKEFFYYAKLLFFQRSEGVLFGEGFITLLALAGAFASFFDKSPKGAFFRYVALFAFANLLILSLIPYKMPWLLLSPFYAVCLLAGYEVSRLLRRRNILSALVGALIVGLFAFKQCGLTRLATQRFHSDPRNPFVSVHTVPDLNSLLERIHAIEKKSSEYGTDIPVCTYMQESPWPLPWHLRGYRNAGFWTPRNPPKNLDVFEVVITDPFTAPEMERSLGEEWTRHIYGLRPNLHLTVFVRKPLFEKSL